MRQGEAKKSKYLVEFEREDLVASLANFDKVG
jgi:hypothetical protein